MKKILLLGGYGNAGRSIAAHLLRHIPGVALYIAGRDLRKAEDITKNLRLKYPNSTIKTVQVDLSNAEQLTAATRQCDFVINAASAMDHTELVVQSLIREKKHCLDTQLSLPDKIEVLKKYAPQLEAAGIIYITDGGFHPGIPAALVRWGAVQFDALEVGNVYCALKVDWASIEYSPSTIRELLAEFEHFNTAVYRNKSWAKPSLMTPRHYNFGAPFGEQPCTPMCLEELRALPEQFPSLRNTGFYVTGFNTLIDYVGLPFILVGIKILPTRWAHHLMQLFMWGASFSKPPFGVQIEAVCRGIKNDEPHTSRLSLRHKDAYALTAMAVVSCFKQWLEGRITSPGLHFQANAVEPRAFVQDLQAMGVDICRESSFQKIKHVPTTISP